MAWLSKTGGEGLAPSTLGPPWGSASPARCGSPLCCQSTVAAVATHPPRAARGDRGAGRAHAATPCRCPLSCTLEVERNTPPKACGDAGAVGGVLVLLILHPQKHHLGHAGAKKGISEDVPRRGTVIPPEGFEHTLLFQGAGGAEPQPCSRPSSRVCRVTAESCSCSRLCRRAVSQDSQPGVLPRGRSPCPAELPERQSGESSQTEGWGGCPFPAGFPGGIVQARARETEAPVPPQGPGTEGESWGTEFKGFLTKQRGFVARNEPSCGNVQRSCSRNVSLASRMLFLAEARETQIDLHLPPPWALRRLPGFQRTQGTCKSNERLSPLHTQPWEGKYSQGSQASSQVVMASLVQGTGRWAGPGTEKGGTPRQEPQPAGQLTHALAVVNACAADLALAGWAGGTSSALIPG